MTIASKIALIIYLPVAFGFYKSVTGETNREPIMTRRIAIAAMLILVLGNQACNSDPKNADRVDYQPAACGSPAHTLILAEHLTEADSTFLERLAALDPAMLPEIYTTKELFELDRSLIAYMLDVVDFDELKRDDLLSQGELGRAILLALGTDPNPRMVEYKDLRRGLYHFYNCSRNHPATLSDFIKVYGDYTAWPSTLIETSDPKIFPRRLYNNAELGVYVAETIRYDSVYETEMLLQGYRSDGALEFLGYLPDGELTNRGEFKAGADFTAGAAPYTCMSCHIDSDTGNYTVIYPDLEHSHSAR